MPTFWQFSRLQYTMKKRLPHKKDSEGSDLSKSAIKKYRRVPHLLYQALRRAQAQKAGQLDST
jgi:hypothetical protein